LPEPAEDVFVPADELDAGFTLTVKVAVPVSLAVKSVGVNKAVTTAVPADTAVALLTLEILNTEGLLEI
jgi:hypothetical protein